MDNPFQDLKHTLAYDSQNNSYNINLESINNLQNLSSKNLLFDKYGNKLKFRCEGKNGKKAHFYLYDEIEKDFYKKYCIFPESLEHKNAKEFLSNFITKNNYFSKTEFLIPEINRFADIFFKYKGQDYVIEIQNSFYDQSEYVQRTRDYKSSGINILWIVLVESVEDINKFNVLFPQNGGYLIYLKKDKLKFEVEKENNLEISDLVKVNETNQHSIHLESEFTFEDFIYFMYDENYGGLNISDSNHQELKREILKNKEKIQNQLDEIEKLKLKNSVILREIVKSEEKLKFLTFQIKDLTDEKEKEIQKVRKKAWDEENNRIKSRFSHDLKYKGLITENEKLKKEIEIKNECLTEELHQIDLKLKFRFEDELKKLFEEIKNSKRELLCLIDKKEKLIDKFEKENFSEERFKLNSRIYFYNIIKEKSKISKIEFNKKINKLIFEIIGELEEDGFIISNLNDLENNLR